jgi:hypothetical protein
MTNWEGNAYHMQLHSAAAVYQHLYSWTRKWMRCHCPSMGRPANELILKIAITAVIYSHTKKMQVPAATVPYTSLIFLCFNVRQILTSRSKRYYNH